MAVVGDAFVRVRVLSSRLSSDIADEVRRQFRGADGAVDREGERSGNRQGEAMHRGFAQSLSRNRKNFTNSASKLASNFGDAFNLGIGRARMGTGIISALTLAAPSLLSGAAAIGTAMAAEIVTALSAIGPGLAGLGSVLAAGAATALLNFGLLYAAFESGAEGLEELKEEAGLLAKELGTPIAKGMLSGMREGVQILRDAMPELNDLLTTTGEKFGQIVKGVAETVTKAENMSRIKGILETNSRFLDNFSVGLNGLTSAFLILFNAAKPLIDYIGEGIAKFGQWAESTLAAKEASGELGETVQGLLDKWKELWEIIKDFGAGIVNIFKAASPVGEKLLESVANIGQKFRDWTGDEANQARMTAFFEKAHTLASKVFEVLGSIFTAGGRAFEDMDLTPILSFLDTLQYKVGPAIAEIFGQIKDAAGPKLAEAFDNIGDSLQKIADSGIIGKIAGWIADLVLAISEFLASDFGSWLAGFGLAWILFGGIIRPIVSLVWSLITALGALGAPVLLIVAAFVLIYTQSEKFRDALGGAFTTIKETIEPVIEWLLPKFQELWEAISDLAMVIGDILAPVLSIIGPLLAGVLFIIIGALGVITEGLTLFVMFLKGLITGDWTDFINKAIELWTSLQLFFAELWQNIAIWAQQKWDEFLIWISGIWDTIIAVGKIKWEEFKTWLGSIWNDIVVAAQTQWDSFTSTLRAAWDTVIATGKLKWEEFKGWLGGIWNNIVVAAQTQWNQFTQVLKAAWDGAVLAAQYVWNSFVGWLNGIWNTIMAAARGAWMAIELIIVSPIIGAYNTVVMWVGMIKGVVGGILTFVQETVATISSLVSTAQANASLLTSSIPGSGIINQIFGGGGTEMAEGGTVPPIPGGWNLIVGEAGQSERIEPLDSQGLSRRDRALISHIVANTMQSATGTSAGTTVQVYLDGREISGMVQQVVESSQDKLKRKLMQGRRIAR